MLGEFNVFATLGVRDLAQGRQFYEQVLGLQNVVKESQYEVVYKSGDSKVQVYASAYAGTNQATAATWDVDDVEAVVTDLKSKGVKFEHYDLPGATLEGDVHNLNGEKAAWFKDPDGNILCVHTEA
jgi:catechol 2,3-dioxygenase-like lactoylglutathione lyase family enzyme